MRKFLSESREDTQRFAAQLARQLIQKKRPVVIALSGDLGSGKTTFTQGFSRGLGIRVRVQSPTFVLAKWYALSKTAAPLHYFVHIDAYRFSSAREARAIGLSDILRAKDAIVLVEWADRVTAALPKEAEWIHFAHRTPHSRIISVHPVTKKPRAGGRGEMVIKREATRWMSRPKGRGNGVHHEKNS